MKAMDLADYIIIKSNCLNKPVSNLMIQKVMYFLNVDYLLNNNGKSLIEDENFERWDYGPTIRYVYNEYSSYGSSEISIPSEHRKLVTGEGNKLEIRSYKLNVKDIDKATRKFIDKDIIKLLKFKDPFELVNECQQEPQWKKLSYNEEYSNTEILKYYKKHKFWET